LKFKETGLSKNYLINLDLNKDERGFFARYFCKKEFSKKGLNTCWVQINNSFSKKVGTLRGLHFQREPYTEIKLVRCLKGSIWDVVVDLRKKSKTFGKWFGATLSDKNRTMMYIPKGFAHGYISLEPDSEILYLVSNFYNQKLEVSLNWNDPEVAINWPIKPIYISNKDKNAIYLNLIKPFNF